MLLLTVENRFALTLKTRWLKAAKWRCHEWITQCQQQCPGRLDCVDANEWFTVQTARSSIWSGSDDFLLLSQVLSITYHNVFITQQPACSDTDRNFHANSWWSQVVVWEGVLGSDTAGLDMGWGCLLGKTKIIWGKTILVLNCCGQAGAKSKSSKLWVQKRVGIFYNHKLDD